MEKIGRYLASCVYRRSYLLCPPVIGNWGPILRFWYTAVLIGLTLLEPQSRLWDKLVNFRVVCPQNGTAVLNGLREVKQARHTSLLNRDPPLYLFDINSLLSVSPTRNKESGCRLSHHHVYYCCCCCCCCFSRPPARPPLSSFEGG